MSAGIGRAPLPSPVSVRVPGAAGFMRPRGEGVVVVLEHGHWSASFAAGALERAHAGCVVATSAVPEVDWPALEAAGFRLRETLTLLELALLTRREAMPGRGVRRGGRRDIPGALAADLAAFPAGAALDRVGFDEARHATHRTRFAVRDTPQGLRGYAISGVAGRSGYLQRLAVHPGAQGRGYGTALVADSLAWLARRGARHALVNTHPTNSRALALYDAFGFRPREARLGVFEATGRAG